MTTAKEFLLLTILLFSSSLFGQNIDQNKLDSLQFILSDSKSTNDSKIEACFSIHRLYKGMQYDSAFHYAEKALSMALGKSDTLTIKAYREIGSLAYMSNDYVVCYDQISKGIQLSKDLNIDYYLTDLYNVHGTALQEQGLLNESMDNFLKSREIAEMQKDTYGLVRVMVNLSYIYYRIKDYDKVFENTKEAIKISKIKKYDNVLFYAYNMLGGAYETIEEHDKSLKYFKRSYEIADSLNMNVEKATALVNIAGEYSRKEKFNEAIGSYTEAKEIFEMLDDQRGRNEVIGSLGEMYLNKKNYTEALKYCTEAYQFSKENEIIYEQEVTCKCLSDIYKNTGDYKNALKYHEEYKMYSDSVFSTERKSELTNVELTYQFDKEKERLRVEQKEKEIILENKNARSRVLVLLLSLLTFLGLSAFLWIRRKNSMIEKQKKKLEEINTTKDKLFAIIGHDLKRPAIALKGISTKVKYLLDNKDYERLNKFGNQIEENANSFNNIVNNLLHWALLQKDVMPYKPQLISLKEIVKHIIFVYQTETQSKNINLIENIPQDLKVYSDEVALNAVLSNLIDNAIKFTEEGGEIKIEGSRQNNKTKISIEDNGSGLTNSQLDKIFSLVKNKTKMGTSGEMGTGLGLHLVHELVKLNKGKITVSSEKNIGTTFEITLPQNN